MSCVTCLSPEKGDTLYEEIICIKGKRTIRHLTGDEITLVSIGFSNSEDGKKKRKYTCD